MTVCRRCLLSCCRDRPAWLEDRARADSATWVLVDRRKPRPPRVRSHTHPNIRMELWIGLLRSRCFHRRRSPGWCGRLRQSARGSSERVPQTRLVAVGCSARRPCARLGPRETGRRGTTPYRCRPRRVRCREHTVRASLVGSTVASGQDRALTIDGLVEPDILDLQSLGRARLSRDGSKGVTRERHEYYRRRQCSRFVACRIVSGLI